MSVLSTFIVNNLIKAFESELVNMTPELKDLSLREIKDLGSQVVAWAEKKLNIDINGNGKIGE